MENMAGKTLKLREDLTLVAIEHKAALLDVDKRRYFDPNDTASSLLKLLEEGSLYEDLRVALVSEFDVAEETAWADVDSFVGELLRLGLVDIEEATTQAVMAEPKAPRKSYHVPQFEPLTVLVATAEAPPSPK